MTSIAFTRDSIMTRFKKLSWPSPGKRVSQSMSAENNRKTSRRLLDHQPLKKQTAGKTATDMHGSTSDVPASDIKKTVIGSVVTLEGTYLGSPIRVRIYCEPAPESNSE